MKPNINLASSELDIGTFNAIRPNKNEKPDSIGKIVDKENNTITSVPLKPAPFIDDVIEDPFQKHLKYPDLVIKNKVSRTSNQFLSAISSKAWRQYYEKKEKEKQDKDNKTKKRKLERELKKKNYHKKEKNEYKDSNYTEKESRTNPIPY